MKIGILTYFIGQNYGAALQAYATMLALQRLGHSPVFIYYYQPWSKGPSFFNPKSYVGRTVGGTFYKCKWMWKHFRLRLKFNQFEQLLPKTSNYGSDVSLLKRTPPDCDLFLVGSDQVWNCSSGFGAVEAYFLPFEHGSSLKISYASSLGGHEFPQDCLECIKKYLSSFTAISVRESSSVPYLNRLGFSNVSWVPDPTLLLSSEDYHNLISNTESLKKYSFVYILNNNSEGLVEKVRRCIGNYELVLNIVIHDFMLAEAKNITVTVQEFVSYLSKASLVVTNSFHCSVFAVLFHRPFFVIPLEGGYKNGNVRLKDFLSEIGLQDRILKDNEETCLSQAEDIDWESVDKRVQALRQRGWDFLNSSLKNCEQMNNLNF